MAQLQLTYNQVKALVEQLGTDEKAQLARYLDSQTLQGEFLKFRDEMEDVPLSMDEITTEVEAVREKRYYAGRYRH